jgi:tRNA threonylcarbamoyl adenosine modification protein (Sua5/YciO/YrdC/YwlC family)
MLLKIHPENPGERNIEKVVTTLKEGGTIISPTDTVYCLACDIYNSTSVERIARIKDIALEKANFSFCCSNLSHMSEFTKPIDNTIFKVMKKALPGPFTFILPANSNVPKIFKSNKKTVGIRIPNNKIVMEIVNKLGHPIMTSSIRDEDEIVEYTTNPELIHEKYKKIVDIVIDGGFGGNIPSTVVDCSDGSFNIVRQGAGKLEMFL